MLSALGNARQLSVRIPLPILKGNWLTFFNWESADHILNRVRQFFSASQQTQNICITFVQLRRCINVLQMLLYICFVNADTASKISIS